MRRWGGSSAVVHEFLGVKEQVDKTRSGSQSHTWHYPKEVYSYYKSAEIHTHKRRLPWKLLALPLMVVMLIFAAWYMYSFYKEKSAPVVQAEQGADPSMPAGYKTSSNDQPQKMTIAQYMEVQTARIDGLPHTAPVYDDLAKPQSVPAPQACVQTAKRCRCYTDQATPIAMDDDLCKQIVENGIYLPHLPAAGAITAEQQKLKDEYDNQS